jgi:putative hydrolase of the HAD superfamily
MNHAAVIFDLFGTLVPPYDLESYLVTLEHMAETLNLDNGKFRREWLDTYESRARGDFRSLDENLQLIASRLGASSLTAKQLRSIVTMRTEFSRRALKPRKDAGDTLTELKRRGFRVGLVSDCTWEIPDLWSDFQLSDLIGSTVFSCRVRMKKPDPRIFLLAAERLGIEASSCIYVGDGSSNELEGARAVGMTPVLIRARDDKADDLPRTDPREWKGLFVESLSDLLKLAVPVCPGGRGALPPGLK